MFKLQYVINTEWQLERFADSEITQVEGNVRFFFYIALSIWCQLADETFF